MRVGQTCVTGILEYQHKAKIALLVIFLYAINVRITQKWYRTFQSVSVAVNSYRVLGFIIKVQWHFCKLQYAHSTYNHGGRKTDGRKSRGWGRHLVRTPMFWQGEFTWSTGSPLLKHTSNLVDSVNRGPPIVQPHCSPCCLTFSHVPFDLYTFTTECNNRQAFCFQSSVNAINMYIQMSVLLSFRGPERTSYCWSILLEMHLDFLFSKHQLRI